MVSLQNFNKKAHEVNSVTDAWIYLLKNAGSEKEIPNFGSDIVKEALERIRVDNLDDETLKTVEREMIAQEEIDCRLAGAKIDTRREMVTAMLAEGLSVEKVVCISKLPESEVR